MYRHCERLKASWQSTKLKSLDSAESLESFCRFYKIPLRFYKKYLRDFFYDSAFLKIFIIKWIASVASLPRKDGERERNCIVILLCDSAILLGITIGRPIFVIARFCECVKSHQSKHFADFIKIIRQSYLID